RAVDVEDARGVVAADGELAGTRALDDKVLGDVDLALGKRDGLSVERRIEDDDVAGRGGSNLGAERAGGAVVEGAGDGERRGNVAIFEDVDGELDSLSVPARPAVRQGAEPPREHGRILSPIDLIRHPGSQASRDCGSPGFGLCGSPPAVTASRKEDMLGIR